MRRRCRRVAPQSGRVRFDSAVPVVAVAVLLAAASISLGSCGSGSGHVKGADAALLPESDDSGPPPVSKSIDLHFYLDASGSMKAFLAAPKAGQNNYFTRVLNKAGDILSESWNANVSFWRFGDGEPRQLDGDGLGKFLSPSAFTDRSTHIEKAIAHHAHGPQEPAASADRHQVKVILTDLWQDKDGAGTLAVLLDNAYLNQESLAVGVLGVRSVFHGKVDLPGHSKPDDAADSMPFYFLISGQAADVRFAIKHLVDDLKIGDPDHFQIVFTRRPVERLLHNLAVTSADKKLGITQDDRLVPGARNRFPVLANVRHDVKLNMDEAPDEQTMNLGPHIKLGVHPKVTAMAYRKAQSSPDPKAADELTVSLNEQPRQLTIHRSLLDASTMYRFQIDLIGDWEQPLANLDSWNLESAEEMVSDRFPEDAKGGRPGRTLSLRHFLNVLRLKMRQYETPLARYYLYVQTN